MNANVNIMLPPNVIPFRSSLPSDVDIPNMVKSTHLFDKMSQSISHSTEFAMSNVVEALITLMSLETNELIGNLYKNVFINE